MIYKSPKAVLSLALLAVSIMATARAASAPVLPNPVLYLTGTEAVTIGGKQFIRYHLAIFNASSYPAEMFAASPQLPPCGKNIKASRTWVDIYAQSGKRLYGFCALGKPEDLNQLHFDLEEGIIPPSWVYLELTDRQTNTKYKSNLAETSL